MKLLYICTDFPFPPLHGGLVDMWNRIRVLHSLGIELDVVATIVEEPPEQDRRRVECLVRRLIFTKRERGAKGIFHFAPGLVAIRRSLRDVRLEDSYDAVLLQTEFVTDILHNRTLAARTTIIRVDNDEYRYAMQMVHAEKSLSRKFYYLFEAQRIRLHTARILPAVDQLWFVSHDERQRYEQQKHPRAQTVSFLPTAVNLGLVRQPSLAGRQVLFIGSLWVPFNVDAVEWYLNNVHPLLSDVEGYSLTIVGSTRGCGNPSLERLCERLSNVSLHFDPEDLTPYYEAAAVFVNPMMRGAGVKLKTIEASVRGLPIVSTAIGVEGSGMVDGVHFIRAESAAEFAAATRAFLSDKEMARSFVSRSQAFIEDKYDQRKVLERLLRQVPKEDTMPAIG